MARSITKERSKVLGDLLRAFYHPGYCFVSAKLVNPVAAALESFMPLGQPVKASGANYVFVLDGDEAATIGLVLHDKPINLGASATSDDLYLILVRGPALVSFGDLPALDIEDDALTEATIRTALAALDPPIICQDPLTPTRTQGVD